MKYAIILCALLAGCGGGGSDVAATPAGLAVTTYGDSTQAAQGNPHASSRPRLTIDNKAIGGSTTAQWLAKWAAEMAATRSPVVVYNGGLNDGGMTVEEYKAALREMVRIARANGKQLVLEQPNNAAEHSTFNLPAFVERRAAVGPLAASEGAYYCSQPDVPLRDGAHPTPEDYATKAARLARCLTDLL